MNTETVLICSNVITLLLAGLYFVYSQIKLNKRAPDLTLLISIDETREDGWISDRHKLTTFGQLCLNSIPVGPRFVISEQRFEQIKEENVIKSLEADKPLAEAGIKVLLPAIAA